MINFFSKKQAFCPKCKKGNLYRCRKSIWYHFLNDFLFKNHTIKTYKCVNCHKITAVKATISPKYEKFDLAPNGRYFNRISDANIRNDQ